MPVPDMIPYFEKVQASGKRLLIRGKLTCEDLIELRRALSPAGFYLQVVVETPGETEGLADFFSKWS